MSRCGTDDLINRALVRQFLQEGLVDARHPAEHETCVPRMVASPSGHLRQVLEGARTNGCEHLGIPRPREDLHQVDDLVVVGPLAGLEQRNESVNPDACCQVAPGFEQDVEGTHGVVSHRAVDVKTCVTRALTCVTEARAYPSVVAAAAR